MLSHIVTLLWLIFTTKLKITFSNPKFGNTSEMTLFMTFFINILPVFQDYFNKIDSTGEIEFTMQIADENGLDFLDLKLKMNENSKINVDVFQNLPTVLLMSS